MRKRGGTLYLAVAIHTEHIQEEKIFESLAAFGRGLPFRPAAFVMTPRSPIIAKELAERGIEETVFTRRLKDLSGLFEIGMHGHYCKPAGPEALMREPAPWIARAGFEQTTGSPAEVRAQFAQEYEYLSATTGKPEIYSGGWWFLNETIVALLGEYGLLSDSSIRYGRADSFGNMYLPASEMPGKGTPFILPPSADVAEFPSVSYLHGEWWMLIKELLPMLLRADGPLFAVLPAHDHDIPEHGEKMLENIRLLSEIINVRFVPFSRMRELALEAGSLKKSAAS